MLFLRWVFVTLPRWCLIGLGAYLVLGLAVIEHGERRFGLGTGVATMLVLAIIKAAALVVWPETSPRPPTASE
jgi:hypothetical protein